MHATTIKAQKTVMSSSLHMVNGKQLQYQFGKAVYSSDIVNRLSQFFRNYSALTYFHSGNGVASAPYALDSH